MSIRKINGRLSIFARIPYTLVSYETDTDMVEIGKMYPYVQFDEFHDYQGCFFEYKGNGFILIRKNDKLKMGDIAHECKHFVNFVFRHTGIKLDIDNDELECYLLEYMVNECIRLLEKSPIE